MIRSPDESSAPMESGQAHSISRRNLLKLGMGSAGLVGAAAMALNSSAGPDAPVTQSADVHGHFVMPGVVGDVDHINNGFNPTDILTDFDAGAVSTLPNGQTLHEYTIAAQNKTIEIVPG